MTVFTIISIATFIAISIAFVIIPGPNVAVIVSTTLTNGRKRGLATVAGTSSAMAIQLLIASYGTGWLLILIAEKLLWLKWIGVAYLAFLGIKSVKQFAQKNPIEQTSELGSFNRGFWISLTNPKTILFFSAFLPQFVSHPDSYIEQISILSLLFWLIALTIDSAYVFAADFVKKGFRTWNLNRAQQGISGALYLFASSVLAFGHRSQ